MPRYLVTLRHAETGETRDVRVIATHQKEAYYLGRDHESIPDEELDMWDVENVAPADDVPVPGRDR